MFRYAKIGISAGIAIVIIAIIILTNIEEIISQSGFMLDAPLPIYAYNTECQMLWVSFDSAEKDKNIRTVLHDWHPKLDWLAKELLSSQTREHLLLISIHNLRNQYFDADPECAKKFEVDFPNFYILVRQSDDKMLEESKQAIIPNNKDDMVP